MQNHVSDFFENQKHVLCEIKTLWFTWNDFKDGFYREHRMPSLFQIGSCSIFDSLDSRS